MKPLRLLILPVFAAIGLAFAAANARADDAVSGDWTLTTAEFATSTVGLVGIDSAGVHVIPSGQSDQQTIGYDNFLEIQRAGASASSPTGLVLRMTNGDVFGGGPVSVKGDTLIWNDPSVGHVSLSMQQVQSINQANVPASTEHPTQDVVSLVNGDVVRGTVVDLNASTVTVSTDTNNIPVPLANVKSIVLGVSGNPPPARRGFRVSLDDGTALTANDATLSGDTLKLIVGKNEAHSIDMARVIGIEQVNGPVSWLSQRPPSESVYTPPFGNSQKYTAQMDRSVTGEPLKFGTQTFAHGIGVHSYSRISWPLDGTYAAFRTQYAIDGDRPMADVTVRIKLDGKTVYEQAHVRSGVLAPVIVEKLDNAKLLTLEVDYGDNLDAQDHLNWLSPALLKTLPPPPPAPVAPATEPATQPSTGAPATQPAAAPTTQPQEQ